MFLRVSVGQDECLSLCKGALRHVNVKAGFYVFLTFMAWHDTIHIIIDYLLISARNMSWSTWNTCNFTILPTIPPQKRSPLYSIILYRPDFQSFDSHLKLQIFKKNLTKSCSSWLPAFWHLLSPNWPPVFWVLIV